jgi:hypothetical protein
MNRRAFFRLSTVVALGLAFLPGSVVPQQRSVTDQLLGAWALPSVIRERADGIGEALEWRAVRIDGDQILRDLRFP